MTVRTLPFLFALTLAASGALAADARATLTPGDYQAGPGGCATPTTAGAMSFDGANWSGPKQFCKTEPRGGDAYRLTCMSLVTDGGAPKTPADFDATPDDDKDVFDLKITVTSPRAFRVEGQTYELCEARK